MTKYGRSPWIDRYPKSRVPSYPRFRGRHDIDVVIIGGGLTGCAAAYGFAAAGVQVALAESGQIGRGATAFSSGWMADDPGVSFVDVEPAIGLRAARSGYRLWRKAALEFAGLIRRLNIKCELEPRSTVLAAITPEQAARLKREQKARKAAGLDAPAVHPRVIASDAAINAVAGMRSRDGATIDPYRAAVGLAAAAADRGALLYERSAVRRTSFGRRSAEVHLEGGSIRTRRIIVATSMPTALFRSLARHFWFKSSFSVLTDRIPAKIRQQLGKRESVIRDLAMPPHILRWVDDDRLLISGADGPAVPIRLRDRTLVQRTGQLMYELSTMYPEVSGIMPAEGWETPYALTGEGLPYIGPHRNYPHHLFAFGDASHSVTGAYLASRVLLRHHLGENDPADEAFGFNRA